ncbi:hypothetical protein APHAL10511_001573 [Amanita phalloides]|nr:hypothetical protein APHAL10511_001573 [Amanita phalloides]
MTNNTLASINDHLGVPAPPRLHKSLQKIGMQHSHPIWGVRMGGSDYAAHSSGGADEKNRRLMYDEQIDLTTPPTTKHATPTEPTIDTHHEENLRVPSRKADRRSIERPRSDSAISHPKNLSRALPTSSPKMLGYAGVPMRKRPRHGSFPASSSPRKSADHLSARSAASLNRKKHRHTTSDSPALVPAPLPQDYMAAPANTWLMPPEVGEGSIQQNYQQFCTSTPNNFHDSSEISLTQNSQQVFTGVPHIGTPMPGYNVPVTPYYGSGPDVNRHASAYTGVSTYQTPATPTFPM